MKSLLASVRVSGGLDRVDHAVQCLEDEWRKHGEVQLERLWTEQKRVLAVDPEESIVLLAELIRTDLRCRYARGQSPSVASYLERFPALGGADSRVLSLIYEEFCLAEEREGSVDVDSFCDRYPRWKDSLVSQLQYHRLFSQAVGPRPEPPPFPEPGDTFEEFQLVSLLGKGGTARVFLARDLSLGGKQVVLKVSLDRGEEPKAQGALDHPHIVPVNSVVYGDRQLRGLSMPYRPGLPLDEVIRRVDPSSRPRRALALWQALVEGTSLPPAASVHDSPDPALRAADGRAELPRGDGWEGFPVRGTYAEGVAWIAMILARALAYAHGMRTFHRDVKPGNVLLTLHHGPQLLDFNLAESPHSASRAEAAMHGGTLPYMAPEQLEAFLNPELWGQVGAKADVYSLGLVLRELLTGQAPDLPAQTVSPPRALRLLLDRRPMLDVSVRRTNPAIPHALEAIVAKCLAVTPEARYPDAQTLADDLDRFLKCLPLVGTTNPSRPERVGNWVRRRRGALATNAAYLLVIAALVFGAVDRVKGWLKPPVETNPRLQEAVRMVDDREFDRAERLLRLVLQEYPDSVLVKLYLSFALDAWDDSSSGPSRETEHPPSNRGTPHDQAPSSELSNPAGRQFEADTLLKAVNQAIRAPAVRKNLAAWARSHPRFASHLEAAALARFDRDHRETQDTQERKYDPQKAGNQRRYLYGLVRPAVEFAAELNRESPVAPRLLAIFDEADGRYRSAYERISPVIDALRAHADSENELDQLYKATAVRARIARRLADQHQENPPPARQALQWMQHAPEDLQFGERYAIEHHDYEKTLYVIDLKGPAFLILSEIEADLGKTSEAREHLQLALETFDRIEEQLPRSAMYNHYWELPDLRKRASDLSQQLELKDGAGRAQPDPGPDSALSSRRVPSGP